MKTWGRLVAVLASALAISAAGSSTRLVAQQAGDQMIFLVPAAVAVGGRDARQVVVVTSKSKGTVTVACKSGTLHRQDGDLLDRTGAKVATTEVAVLFPEGIELPPGTRLGAFRPAGQCGSEYVILHGHVLAEESN